jgi:O-antigen biosynthesis protein
LPQEDDPLISVITVNWNGKKYLSDLFSSLMAQNYPRDRLQIIMVDNASTDGSADYVKRKFPEVEIVRLEKNLGYAGGNNEGFKRARGRYIALINNDCIADPDWLCEMLSIFKRSSDDAKIGAVGPKVVFFWPYISLQLLSGSINSRQDGDKRTPARRLGIKILDARVKSSASGSKWESSVIKYMDGFHPPETDDRGRVWRWSQGNAAVALPIYDLEKPTYVELRLSSRMSPNHLKAVIGEEIIGNIRLGKRTRKIMLRIQPEMYIHKRDIINSCGVKINRSLYSRDRGFMDFDDGQYRRVEEVFALSGSSFMADRKMLEDAGYFDQVFFTYYEDIDLFWRARLKGWKHFFTPNALVRHHHCGSGQEWSYDFTYNVLRNRLLMIFKCGWPALVLRCLAAFTAAMAIHSVYHLARLLRGDRTKRIDIGIRFRIFFRLFYLLPAFLPRRASIRSSRKIKDRQIRQWFRDFK